MGFLCVSHAGTVYAVEHYINAAYVGIIIPWGAAS